ncbi:hypothetical protein ACROYT_G035412 [Oculina patagonica]
MASNMAGIAGLLVLLLFSPLCLAKDKKVKTPVIPPNQQLRNENWDRMLKGEWMVKFFAPWCPACQQVGPVWSTLALKAEKLGINVGEVDTTKEPVLSGRFMVFSLPTIYHVKNGEFRKYEGSRSLKGFTDFISGQKWREIEPVPWWKSPSSHLMGCLGLMFKLSVILKDTHELLTVTYRLPVWASYTIFGVLTVLVGILLGVGIVFLSDCIFGGPSYHSTKVPAQPLKKESEEESGEEDEDGEEEEKPKNKNDQGGVRKRVAASTD